MKMPVRFKGLSEYKKNYKWKSSRSPSPEHRAPWAGLRSDQLGITKEPSFMSKKRVPHYRPQISRSFQWVHGGETPRHSAPQREAARRSVKTHAPVTEEQAAPERIRTPLGPRVPRLPRSQSVEPRPRSAPHSPLANGKSMPSLNAEKGGPAAEGNGVNRVLQKKAGLKTDMRRSVARSSEYQRQFMWKTPLENSPLLAAEQLVYNRNKEVPPFKSGSFVRESEYQRSFKSSPPPKGLRLRKDLEEQEAENISPVSNSKVSFRIHTCDSKLLMLPAHLCLTYSLSFEKAPHLPSYYQCTRCDTCHDMEAPHLPSYYQCTRCDTCHDMEAPHLPSY